MNLDVGLQDKPVQLHRRSLLHVRHRALYKCCLCIHLRAGGFLICLIWLLLSMVLGTLAFKQISPFFSYLNPTAHLLFGVANVVLGITAVLGFVAFFSTHPFIVRPYSQLVWATIFLYMIDCLINLIIFLNERSKYFGWCENKASDLVVSELQQRYPNGTLVNVTFDISKSDYGDLFNCERLYSSEIRLALLALIMMLVIFIYWATCIWSYSHKRKLWFIAHKPHLIGTVLPQPPPPPVPPVNQPLAQPEPPVPDIPSVSTPFPNTSQYIPGGMPMLGATPTPAVPPGMPNFPPRAGTGEPQSFYNLSPYNSRQKQRSMSVDNIVPLASDDPAYPHWNSTIMEHVSSVPDRASSPPPQNRSKIKFFKRFRPTYHGDQQV
ncbi:uncharacterized protein VTP21DRAFT_3703 [Calcarisporiella thermophila]|uniref:uncharacterized protein n=1 Tax=Calcarisporiella thermophila TaxID=911321 RepID=UPI003741FC59